MFIVNKEPIYKCISKYNDKEPKPKKSSERD